MKGKDKILKEIIQYSRKAAKKNMSKFLLGIAIYLLLQGVSSIFGYSDEIGHTQMRNIVITFIVASVALWIMLGFKNLALKVVYNIKIKSNDIFVNFQTYLKYVAAYMVTYIIVIIGIVLLIIPGILFSIKLSMVPYLILDKNMKPFQAIKTSWKITRGFVGNILWLNVLCGLINIVGMLALFVGLLWTIPLFMIANAYLYKKIVESQKLEDKSQKLKA